MQLFQALLDAIDEIVHQTNAPRWIITILMLLFVPPILIAGFIDAINRAIKNK